MLPSLSIASYLVFSLMIYTHTQAAWLPKLPVPPLEQTMAAYLEAVQVAVGDPEQVAETRRIVEQFMRPGGVGLKLQDQLMDKQSKEDNWVQIV